MRKVGLLLPLFLLGLDPEGSKASAQARSFTGRWAELEDFLETAEVVEIKMLGEGANQPRKLMLTKSGITRHGLWKPIDRGKKEWGWESYQAEVAAYQLDRILELGMVPPTVVREIDGLPGSLQLWMEGCRLYRDIQGETSPDPARWERQLSRMKVFDNLISNWDRSAKNFLVDADWSIILIDHSQAFLSTRELSPNEDQLPSRFERRLVKELERLEPDYLKYRFGRLLLDPQITAISARRDGLLMRLRKLVADRGEDAVIF
jgi:hypothetical protein